MGGMETHLKLRLLHVMLVSVVSVFVLTVVLTHDFQPFWFSHLDFVK